MVPTGFAATNSRNESLNNSGTSSGATIPKLRPTKIRRNEITLAFPAIAVGMANEEVIVVKSSSSDTSSNNPVVTEQRLLARQRREEARIAKAIVTMKVAHLEARLEEARRAASNTGSTVRAEGAESDGGSSGVQ